MYPSPACRSQADPVPLREGDNLNIFGDAMGVSHVPLPAHCPLMPSTYRCLVGVRLGSIVGVTNALPTSLHVASATLWGHQCFLCWDCLDVQIWTVAVPTGENS
jgi:hypothetical protein